MPLTVEEVAKRLHIKPKTVHAWVRAGHLDCIQQGRTRRFTEHHLREWAERWERRSPKRIDVEPPRRLFSDQKSQKGGVRFTESSARERRRMELL